MWTGFFQSEALVAFVLEHAQAKSPASLKAE
jgi:hypothetical protein